MASKTKTVAANPLKAIKAQYGHVVSVTKIGVKGQAIRIEIRCTEQGCSTTREIATQDAFQVQRCRPCQAEFAKIKRRKTPTEEPKQKSPQARKRRRRAAKKAA